MILWEEKLSSIIKLSINNFIDERLIKIRLDFRTVPCVEIKKKKKKSKIRTGKMEGKSLATRWVASKLGLVPRIPESQFSLGRNWARLVGPKARNGARARIGESDESVHGRGGGRRGEDETCQVAWTRIISWNGAQNWRTKLIKFGRLIRLFVNLAIDFHRDPSGEIER